VPSSIFLHIPLQCPSLAFSIVAHTSLLCHSLFVHLTVLVISLELMGEDEFSILAKNALAVEVELKNKYVKVYK